MTNLTFRTEDDWKAYAEGQIKLALAPFEGKRITNKLLASITTVVVATTQRVEEERKNNRGEYIGLTRQ